MKKMFMPFVLLFCFIVFSPITKADYIGAFRSPVQLVVLGNVINHTYSCINSLNPGSCQSFSPAGLGTGNTYGGDLMGGSWIYATPQQTIKAWRYSGCYMTYALNGVCHQYTNRILYAVGREMANNGYVMGYTFSKWKWGPRGTNFSQCNP
jgi:hypothetical protein